MVDDTAMRVDATPAASLRDNGQYEEPESRTPIPLDYRFEQVEGEWRISIAPTGILIDQVSFAQVFREYTLYFFDPTHRYLVPDVRWYAGRDSAQTSIVQALLAGPAEWLAPGVVSAFPEGVELDPAAVPVAGGVASVSLAGAAFDDLADRAAHGGAAGREPHRRAEHRLGRPHAERRRPRRARRSRTRP